MLTFEGIVAHIKLLQATHLPPGSGQRSGKVVTVQVYFLNPLPAGPKMQEAAPPTHFR